MAEQTDLQIIRVCVFIALAALDLGAAKLVRYTLCEKEWTLTTVILLIVVMLNILGWAVSNAA